MEDQNFKTSFIPTKPIQPVTRGGDLGRTSGGNFLTVITIVIFVATLLASAGVFGYRWTLDRKVNNQIAELEKVKESLNSPLINEADRLNSRIESVKSLLAKHVAPDQIFSLLEQTTLQTVKFDNLSYQQEADGVIKINAAGQALGFQSIVLQSDQYGDTGYLRNILFSGLQPNSQGGGVNFNLQGTVDNQLVLYRTKLTKENNATTTDSGTGTDTDNSGGDSFEFPDGSATGTATGSATTTGN